mgnify:CR=1 FL=1|jgi:hypothetical protein|tara:strand:- start:17169 stop:17807 length:639 start_codon:yes stop_codon:yes gene_type:complete
MTYYVQKNVFTAGAVADADNLMEEFYRVASAMSSIDQNNIAPYSINYSVAIPPNPADAFDMQRGPFVCYDEDSPQQNLLYSTAGSMSGSDLTNIKFNDVDSSGFDLRFTSRVSAKYHFFLQATATRAVAHSGPLKIDAIIRLNGSAAGGTNASFSTECKAGGTTNRLPISVRATQFLEPGTWHVTPSFRPRVDDTNMPSITNISIGVIGFIR